MSSVYKHFEVLQAEQRVIHIACPTHFKQDQRLINRRLRALSIEKGMPGQGLDGWGDAVSHSRKKKNRGFIGEIHHVSEQCKLEYHEGKGHEPFF